MIKAALHSRERERLIALEDLKILDTLPEKEFDDITSIASQICGTPIALISLVDDRRQWFKSKVGLDAAETPRDVAFCSHALLQNDIFVVPDSSKDERFHDNPLATGFPHVKFYAGAPLFEPYSQLPIGTLCVIDDKPRTLTPEQLAILKSLSNQIYKLLELRIQIAKLTAINEKLIFQKTAFDNMSEGLVIQDQAGKILDFNQAALTLLELSEDQLKGKTSMDPHWHCIREDGSNYPGQEHPAMLTLKTGQPQKRKIMGIRFGEKEPKWISINAVPVFLNGQETPTHSVTTFFDISHEKVAQQTLFQSAKMTSLGEMAGGIAHEINSPLAIINLAAQQIQKYLEPETIAKDKVLQKVEQIERTVARISQIIRGLRTFSRDSNRDPWQECSFLQVVTDTVALCQEKFKNSGIKIEQQIPQDQIISCIPTQISQIVLNLLNNAFDVVMEKNEKWIKISLKQVDQRVRLRITDSGQGISSEVLPKLMQPFFTTKQVGQGTGLGLSISKGIAESFKGTLYYELHQGHTSFVLDLPAVSTQAVQAS